MIVIIIIITIIIIMVSNNKLRLDGVVLTPRDMCPHLVDLC